MHSQAFSGVLFTGSQVQKQGPVSDEADGCRGHGVGCGSGRRRRCSAARGSSIHVMLARDPAWLK